MLMFVPNANNEVMSSEIPCSTGNREQLVLALGLISMECCHCDCTLCQLVPVPHTSDRSS